MTYRAASNRGVKRSLSRLLSCVLLAGTLASATLPLAARADEPATTLSQAGVTAWSAARSGNVEGALSALRTLGSDDPVVASLRASVKSLDEHFAARETMRAERITKVLAKLDEALGASPLTPASISKGLRYAVEWHMLSTDKDAVLKSERVQRLTEQGAKAARESEAKGDWLMAAELFARLHMLHEEAATFKKDTKRLGDRLSMLRLYVPKRLYDLRSARRAEDKLPALPAYNANGEAFEPKLQGITPSMILQALRPASRLHVERTTMRSLLLGGLDAIKTMVTTHDLEAAFPGIAQKDSVDKLVAFIDGAEAKLQGDNGVVSDFAASEIITQLLETNNATVKILDQAILHEFGNGAFSHLDDFSQLVWPDEVARFRRMTQGSFIGVGIQIQMDDERQMIKIVMPLEGTPAQRAGVKAGDLIKKIGGVDATGMSLDQAVEQITGKAGSPVTLVVEREGADVSFDLVRERIPLRTVKGWARTGPKDTDWNWFIDPVNKIGYIRLSGFNASSETSSAKEIRSAIQQMQRDGARGLIFDLRFNPGGLMDQAVQIVNLFVDEGTIVYTERAGGIREQTENAENGRAIAANLPLVVLINDNSASASEIVSGALRHYADQGKVNAVVLGDRSFGKGSVQNVMTLAGGDAEMRLTTQYYFLPNGRLVHRREGAHTWGVEPHLNVEMLPQQISDSLLLRQEVDLPPDASRVKPRKPVTGGEDPDEVASSVLDGAMDPARLLNEPLDLQLQTALVLLQAQVGSKATNQAQKPEKPIGPG